MRKFFLIFFNILRIVTIFLRLHNILDLISDLFLYFEYEVSLRTVHPEWQFILSDSSSSETVHPQRQFILSDSSSSVTVHPEDEFSQDELSQDEFSQDELFQDELSLRMNCLWGWTVSGQTVSEDELTQDEFFKDELSQDELS